MFLSKSTSGIYQLYFIDSTTGRRRKVSTHARMKSDALKFLRSFEVEKLRKPVSMILSQFKADFLTYAERTYSDGTYHIYKEILGKFIAFTGDIPLTKISSHHVDMFTAERLKHIRAVSANIEFRTVKAALNTAVRWGLIQCNPFSRCKAPRPEEKSPKFFSKEDFQRLMETMTEAWLKNVVWFALFTGMRRSEIINLSGTI
jgi:integrase